MGPVAPLNHGRRWLKGNLFATAISMLTIGVGVASAATGGGIGPDDPAPSGTGGDATFPIVGKHSYGDGFGAGRSHEGQDVFAKCGTRLVAAQGGRIQLNKWDDAAGNYLVIDVDGTRIDEVYAHMSNRAVLRKGDRVETGETIGRVGQTGNASGCHLHFEMWSRPGYYEGGHAMASVTRTLKSWDRAKRRR